MAHSYHHAVSSARKWGGTPDDYQSIHDWMDGSKLILADFRHRALRHLGHFASVLLLARSNFRSSSSRLASSYNRTNGECSLQQEQIFAGETLLVLPQLTDFGAQITDRLLELADFCRQVGGRRRADIGGPDRFQDRPMRAVDRVAAASRLASDRSRRDSCWPPDMGAMPPPALDQSTKRLPKIPFHARAHSVRAPSIARGRGHIVRRSLPAPRPRADHSLQATPGSAHDAPPTMPGGARR